jgi:NADH-quinone oxidoreductase subunit J
MPSLLFYFFAAITLGFGLNVLLARNPVTSALSLAVSFVGLAALFIGLDAYFIGTIQVLVYAGAVMVLFLFILMLLDIKSMAQGQKSIAAVAAGSAVAVILATQIIFISGQLPLAGLQADERPLDPKAAVAARAATGMKNVATITRDLEAGELPDAKLMGETLYQKYAFHLQLVGLLLLVGTVGVVVLSKRDAESPAA